MKKLIFYKAGGNPRALRGLKSLSANGGLLLSVVVFYSGLTFGSLAAYGKPGSGILSLYARLQAFSVGDLGLFFTLDAVLTLLFGAFCALSALGFSAVMLLSFARGGLYGALLSVMLSQSAYKGLLRFSLFCLPCALILSVCVTAYAAFCLELSKATMRKLFIGTDEKTNLRDLLFAAAFVLCAFFVAFLILLIGSKFSV